MYYKGKTVWEEAQERVAFIFDNCDDVIVSMSGGKDSTVAFHLALAEATKRGRLPLKVFWLDQEAEWQATSDFMEGIMRREDVKPYWFQIPFDFTNSLSHQDNFLRVWDENKPDEWIRAKSDISIKENPSPYNRFHDLVENLPSYCTSSDVKQCGLIVGMRINESLNRKMAITASKYSYKGIKWCRKPIKNIRVFYPIYDFEDADIWTAIGTNKWEYNRIYDLQYQYGIPRQRMRVSALIHETAWHSIEMLQEFEPKTYNKFIKRVHGTSTFNHMFENIMVNKLPFAFKDWKEYRDYLLVKLVKPEYHELFRKRWAHQEGDEWYKVHVKEVMVNDIDGTINGNAKSRFKKGVRGDKNNRYYLRDVEQYKNWRDNND